MAEKRLFPAGMIAILLIVASLSTIFFQVTAEVPLLDKPGWTVIERGGNFVRRQNITNPNIYSWESAPQWVYNGTFWVPYIFEETAEYYQVQSGLIGTRIYKDGYAEFWNPDMTEIKLYEERWILEYYDNEWKVCDVYSSTFIVENDSVTINITASFITDYPNSGERAFDVKYIFREGRPLKHEITFTSHSTEEYLFRVKQKWAGIVADKVKHGKGTDTITSPTNVNSSWFSFQKNDGSLSIFENQWEMYYGYNETTHRYYVLNNHNLKPVEIDAHAQGLKADFIFGNWTLSQDESLTIDPDTATLDDPSEDGHIVFYFAGYGRDNTGTSIFFGGHGDGDWVSDYRGYVEWSVSSLAGATLTANPVFKYDGWADAATDEEINPITEEQPSDGGCTDPELYGYIATGTAYVNPFNFQVGNTKEVDLGTFAKSDLQDAMDASQTWFAIGLQSPNDEGETIIPKFAVILSEEYGPVTPPPTLYVEYTYIPTQSNQKIWNATTKIEKPLNATDVDLYPTCFNITINDLGGDKMNITIKTNASGSWLVVNQTSDGGLSNGTYSFYNTSWVDSYSTTYYITFNVTDNMTWTNKTFHFTTRPSNYVPVVSDPYPSNESTDVSLVVTIGITVADADGHSMNITWGTNASGSWQQIGLNHTNINDGTYYKIDAVNFEKYNTTYWWGVNVTDGIDWTNKTYSFTTTTFLEEPSLGTIHVFGTEYAPGEKGTIYAQLFFGNNTPANNANVYITVWERLTKYIDSQQMVYITGSNGGYLHNFTVPNNITVFFVDVNCSDPLAYGGGEFHVSQWASDIGKINDTVNYINSTYLPTLESTINDIYALSQEIRNNVSCINVSWGAYTAQMLYASIDNIYNVSYYLNNTVWASYIAHDLFNISNLTHAIVDNINSRWGNHTAYDLFNISNMTYCLADDIENIALHINTSILNEYKVRLTNFGEVNPGDNYLAQVTVFKQGIMTNADAVPTITLYDSNGNMIIAAVPMTWISTGRYIYSYVTPATPAGQWTTITTTTVNGNTVQNIEYWELEANPPEVTVAIVDDVIPEICAEITITNEGISGQEYIYYWWITPRADGDLIDPDTVDSGSASKFVMALDTFVTTKCLTVSEIGVFWFKVCVYWGTERSSAMAQFESKSPPSVPSVAGVGVVKKKPKLTVFCIDKQQNPLEGVKIDIYEDVRFLGSSVTDSEGKTVFILPREMTVTIKASKHGYEPVEQVEIISRDTTTFVLMSETMRATLPWVIFGAIIICSITVLCYYIRKQEPHKLSD